MMNSENEIGADIQNIKPGFDRHFYRNLFIICVSAIVYYLLYFRRFLIQMDEGVILGAVDRLLQGQKWGTDFFAQYGFLKYWIMSKVFAVTGIGILSERFFFIALRLPALALMYAVGLRILPPRWAAGATVAAILIPGHLFKSDLMIITMLQIWLLFKWWENPQRRLAFAVGFAAAFSIWTRTEPMFVLLPAAFVCIYFGLRLKKNSHKEIALQSISFLAAIPIGVFCLRPIFPGMFIYFGWFYRFFESSIASKPSVTTNSPGLKNLIMGLDPAATFLCFAATLAIYGLYFVDSIRKRPEGQAASSRFYRIAICLTGGVMLYNALIQSNLAHLVQVCSPVYLLFADLFYRTKNKFEGRVPKLVTALFFGGIAVSYVLYGVWFTGYPDLGSFAQRRLATTPVNSRLGLVYTTDPPAAEINSVIGYIESHTLPDDPVICYPQCGMVQIMTGRPNPTMVTFFFSQLGYLLGPEITERVYKDTLKARYIIFFERPTYLETPRSDILRAKNYDMRIYYLIASHFTVEERFGRYLIFIRGEDPTGATRVFMDGWELYKYNEKEAALGKFTQALSMGAPARIVEPLIAEIKSEGASAP